MCGMSEEEKIMLARSLAATPDERWAMNENFLREHGIYSYWDRKKKGFDENTDIGDWRLKAGIKWLRESKGKLDGCPTWI